MRLERGAPKHQFIATPLFTFRIFSVCLPHCKLGWIQTLSLFGSWSRGLEDSGGGGLLDT